MGTRIRQIVIVCSVLYLAALIALAGYAVHSTNVYSLPIPNIVSAFAVALPPLAGVALETVMSMNNRLADKGQIQTSRVFQVTVAFFLVYETVLATLAGTHVNPREALECGLHDKWMRLFKAKDADSIRRIQDTFDCCGFRTTLDMGFPFPPRPADTCAITYDRDTACLEPWRQEERKVGIMLMVVAIGVFLWKILIILAPSSQSAWLPSAINLPGDSATDAGAAGRNHRSRPAIAYRDLEDGEEDDSLRQEVNHLNEDSHLATQVEGNRRRPGMFNEANQWREARNTTS